ncbi:hypothetical protein GCM10027277_51800 [Pseudoduganella ginsengisoli]|uniref:Uncharacterized protein n=1 Tax=Pseudoduganella ginsengisoli TaxID=1462440 RepID=A0A6L6Q3Z3_9BURK|nr:hypothetical protein [Pseudoduganella ginsengisoli]MTW04400.1 hypothetical protein [Pseudoduganella ginsengisoli]
MRHVTLAAMLALAFGAQGKPPDKRLTGTWVVTQVLDAQPTTSISSDEADALVGTQMSIDPEHIRFAGTDCIRPEMKTVRRRFYSYFVRNYNIEPKGIPLPDVVSEITITCKKPVGIDYIYVRDSKEIVVYWEGFFLNAVKR